MLHKDLQNKIHDDMNGEALHLLPAGCVPITDEEAQAIQAEIEANQPVVIPTITMRQARMMLLNEGLLDEVNLAITTDEQKIWWDYSSVVERNHPLVDAVLTALGKTSLEIDSMFISASLL